MPVRGGDLGKLCVVGGVWRVWCERVGDGESGGL